MLITLIWFFISIASRLIPPLVPIIIEDLGTTAFLVGIALTAERIAKAVVEFPSGRVGDQLTRSTVLLGCITFVIAGVTILSIAFSYLLFLVGMIVLGLGRGMYAPTSRALLSDLFTEKRGRAFGINMLGSEVAGIAGAGIAIVIVEVALWQTAFFPIALVLAPLLVAFYFLSRESICVSTVTLDVRETGTRLFTIPSIRWVLIVYSLYVVAASGVSTFLPLFLIEVHDVSFGVASSAFALLYAAGVIAKPLGGSLSDYIPRLYTAGGSLALASSGLAVLVVAPSAAVAILGVFVYGLGYRGAPPDLQAYLMDRFPDDSMGGDLGAMRTVYLLVGSFGPAYAGFAASTIGFTAAFINFLLFYVFGAIVLLWMALGWGPEMS